MSTPWVLFFLQLFSLAKCFFNVYPKITSGEPDDGDPGTPLFLTPFVESGNIIEGRSLARVPLTDSLDIESYAGFFTVDKKYSSNQFFWYFPAMNSNRDAPVVIWLQGGPGTPSVFGLFIENGPLRFRNEKLERRKYTWALNHHVIYIDSPVGTGFSFTKDPEGYCTNQTQVGEHLYSTLIQFFQLFPELQQNKFFVAGESYAGKFVPTIAYTIHKKNPDAKIKINLKAISIGNGLCDPEHQLVYSKYLYQIGLIDWNQAQIFADYENKIIDFIQKQQWFNAVETFDHMFYGESINRKCLFYNMTGFHFPYNYLYRKGYFSYRAVIPLLQKSFFRNGIHVGNLTFNTAKEVEKHLLQDMMQSVAPILSELLDHYNVLMYNGQLDIMVANPSTVNFLRKLNFSGSEEYATAKRHQWMVDGELAGYVKRAGRLIQIMVRNAGHMVPTEQPQWTLDMITRLTHEKSFSNDV